MKIWGEIPKVSGVYDKKRSVGKVEGENIVRSTKDLLSISTAGKDYQTVLNALKDTPDIRKDVVDKLKDRYEAGEYEVKETDIADKILKSVTDKEL